jgi:LysM repeat protein
VTIRRASLPTLAVVLSVGAMACGGGGDDAAPSASLLSQTATTYAVIDPPTTTSTTTTTLAPPPAASGNTGGASTSDGTYTVRSGDSVFRIAGTFGLTPEALAAANGWPDGIQHTILPGDVVLVAAGATATGAASSGAASAAATAPPGTPAPQAGCPTTYTITASDTTRIKVAGRFGITYQEMDAANANTPGYASFVVGTPITIPCPAG